MENINIMSRYFSDAVNLLGLLIILVIVLCSYLDVNTVHELLKKTIEELPFGSYVITIYEIKMNIYQTSSATTIWGTTLEISKELFKFVINGYIYHFIVRNIVGIILYTPLNTNASPYKFWYSLKASLLCNIGYVLTAILADGIVQRISLAHFWSNSSHQNLFNFLQTIIYTLISTIGIGDMFLWR